MEFSASEGKNFGDLRDFLLRPLKVCANFARILHAIGEASASFRKASLRLCLQLEQFTLLRIEVAGSIEMRISGRSQKLSNAIFWLVSADLLDLPAQLRSQARKKKKGSVRVLTSVPEQPCTCPAEWGQKWPQTDLACTR